MHKHVNRTVESLLKELVQLNDQETLIATDPKNLTETQKKKYLKALSIITGKRDESPKGRTCTHGRKHRHWGNKVESASHTSPTSHTDLVLLTSVADACEERFVGVDDAKGAHLNAEFDEFLLIIFERGHVDVMCNVEEEHRKHIVNENGKGVLHLVLSKALHCCVQSALLWCKILSSLLINIGFELNPCDLCVANKNIDGSQCTIVHHVDDNKISHKKIEAVKYIVDEL